MKVSIIGGTGYVGLVTGAGLAACGNEVICADIDETKIDGLCKGVLPIYERGLEEIISKAMNENKLRFTTSIANAVAESEIIMIAVGTPENHYGDTDLSQLVRAVKSIAFNMNEYKLIVLKSTVPVGTCELVSRLLKDNLKYSSAEFEVVSNPEFLREGSAVRDFMQPERIIIGTDSMRAAGKMKELYKSFGAPILLSDVRSTEMAKYACNSYLASRISFINEIAEICEKVGADIHSVINAMKLDKRIGSEYLNPGPGFGGPCLSKDLKSLINFSQRAGANVNLLKAVVERNELQVDNLLEYIFHRSGVTEKSKVAILGLSFKAGTDDIRNSPAIMLIEKLVNRGIRVTAYDPLVKGFDSILDSSVNLVSSIDEAVQHIDCLIIMTDLKEFKEINLKNLKNCMRTPSIVDTRNVIPAAEAVKAGFNYKGIGVACNGMGNRRPDTGNTELRNII